MNKLKNFREQFDIKRAYLANEIGVTERYIYFIEANKRTPSLYMARKIANFFEVQIEDIFF